MVPYAVWDVETTITTSYKRKGNPFDPANYVVMSGYKFGPDPELEAANPVIGDYFGTQPKPSDWFIKLLKGTRILVGQNIKFDVLYALTDKEHGAANLLAWMEWVANGGIVWDIQLAEYLLEGMDPASHMLSLDELAPKYGGNVKFDEVKALWEAGVNTCDINPDLLRRYLCGDDEEHGDIGNTEVVFLGQYERARAAGQVKSILLNMGSLLCTIEMERNGMAVDVEQGYKDAAELAERLTELGLELAEYIPKDLPFDFNWASNFHKSALVFGGAVKYKAKANVLDDEGNLTYYQTKKAAYTIKGEQVFDPTPEQLLHADVYASGKNKGEFKTKQVTVPDIERGPKQRIEDFVYEFPGYTTPEKSWQGAQMDALGKPIYGTGAKIMEELGLRDDVPFLQSLTKVVSLQKDLGTYYITTDPETGESKGMLTLVQIDGIIHHMLNHTSTVTARFSSSNPNLQNLPKEGKSTVKTLFISRFKGGKIIQSDFTSLEVYIQAILTKCKQLILDLKAGLDMHCVRVSQKEGVTYEEAVVKCKGDKKNGIEADPVWAKKRSKAKSFSFERAYGAGASKIATGNKIPLEEVEAMIEAENARYPEIEKFYDDMTVQIKTNSQPSGKVTQHPEVVGVTCFFRKSYYRTPDNKLYSYRESPSPEYLVKKGITTSFSPTEIKNYIVQGEGGEWAKAAMWIAIRAYYKRGNFGGLALLVNQVHDALYADADDSVAYAAAVLLEAAMVAASEFMEWYFGWNVPVPVPSETKWGANMMEENDIPGNFKDDVERVRRELRVDYMKGYMPSWEMQLAA